MRIVATLVALTGVVLSPEHAFGDEAAIIRIEQTTCRDLLKIDPEESNNLHVYYHGFISGQRDEFSADIDVFADASARVLDACIDAPERRVLDVFREARLGAEG